MKKVIISQMVLALVISCANIYVSNAQAATIRVQAFARPQAYFTTTMSFPTDTSMEPLTGFTDVFSSIYKSTSLQTEVSDIVETSDSNLPSIIGTYNTSMADTSIDTSPTMPFTSGTAILETSIETYIPSTIGTTITDTSIGTSLTYTPSTIGTSPTQIPSTIGTTITDTSIGTSLTYTPSTIGTSPTQIPSTIGTTITDTSIDTSLTHTPSTISCSGSICKTSSSTSITTTTPPPPPFTITTTTRTTPITTSCYCISLETGSIASDNPDESVGVPSDLNTECQKLSKEPRRIVVAAMSGQKCEDGWREATANDGDPTWCNHSKSGGETWSRTPDAIKLEEALNKTPGGCSAQCHQRVTCENNKPTPHETDCKGTYSSCTKEKPTACNHPKPVYSKTCVYDCPPVTTTTRTTTTPPRTTTTAVDCGRSCSCWYSQCQIIGGGNLGGGYPTVGGIDPCSIYQMICGNTITTTTTIMTPPRTTTTTPPPTTTTTTPATETCCEETI